jgi:hypothetical protein
MGGMVHHVNFGVYYQ